MEGKKIAIVCTLLFCICVMTACEDAPERAEQDALQQESDLTVSEDDTGKFVSLEEAREEVRKLEESTVEGISLPEHIEMPDTSTVSDVTFTLWGKGKEEDFTEAIKNLWADYGEVDWTAAKETNYEAPGDETNNWVERTDKKTGARYNYMLYGGFFSAGASESAQELSCVKQYDFEWGDTAGKEDVYRMDDGEVSVADAVTLTEQLFNDNLSVLEKERFTYKVQHLYVMKHKEDENHEYTMVIGRVYDGMYLDTSSDFNLSDGRSHAKTHCGKHIMAAMRHKGELDHINICDELLEIETETKEEKIISPMWAVQKINEEIAHGSGMSFQDAGLVYLMVQDNKSADDNVQGIYQGIGSGTETHMRPVWLFMSANHGAIFSGTTNDVHGASVIVDALDGTLYYYEGTGAY